MHFALIPDYWRSVALWQLERSVLGACLLVEVINICISLRAGRQHERICPMARVGLALWDKPLQ